MPVGASGGASGTGSAFGGKFYTSDLKVVEALRENLGPEARIETINFPTEQLSKFEVRPGEFVIETAELTKKPTAVELGPIEPKEPKAEPLVPEVLAEKLDNYVKSEGDITKSCPLTEIFCPA